MQGGLLYLVAIMDWASRRVLAWRLSNTMDTEFCLAALAEALEGYGIPEIFNTDQGSQFTSIAFTGLLETTGIRCSMDGRWRNNSRRWRSEQKRQAVGMGRAGIREGTGARAVGTSYPHIHRLVHPLPGPHPRYRRLISTRRDGVTTNGIHLKIPPLTVQLTVATSVSEHPRHGAGITGDLYRSMASHWGERSLKLRRRGMQRTHAVAIATVAIMVAAGLAFALDEKQEYGNCVVVTDRDYFTDKETAHIMLCGDIEMTGPVLALSCLSSRTAKLVLSDGGHHTGLSS